MGWHGDGLGLLVVDSKQSRSTSCQGQPNQGEPVLGYLMTIAKVDSYCNRVGLTLGEVGRTLEIYIWLSFG